VDETSLLDSTVARDVPILTSSSYRKWEDSMDDYSIGNENNRMEPPQESSHYLKRSALHRCLKRHGISRLPEAAGGTPGKKRFKQYPVS
jgi:hypothetical protein